MRTLAQPIFWLNRAMFKIVFETTAHELETDGVLTIGDHWESFTASHSVWDRRRYEQAWREAADRVLAGQPGCFVINLTDGEGDYRGECWVVWPEGDVGVVQNQLLLASSGFDPDRPHAFLAPIPLRVTEEGHHVSTWRVRLTDIKAWRQHHVES